ncbi:hypothetical protein IFR05_015749 [Cadophora sp. M221]|nr:hypothetical protein IFR05_015749 [Cadophora sp. M221]
MSVLQMATKAAGAATTSSQRKRKVHITINSNAYQRLECIGRGGSCRVYRVMSENFKIWALKKVSLADVDEQAVRGFKGEIDLLRKLSKVDRVVQLRDWEVNEAKQTLSVLMEFGEVDLDTILKRHIHTEHPTFDAGFTLFHWKEMLECVAAVHQHDVVHSDLKPANFLLVKGSLKLIDFDDTINVHRDHQVGTPDFMAPEALSFARADTAEPISGAGKLVKLGKPSDIWSLGCILYLMVYGEPSFAQCRDYLQKAMLITNPRHVITYPSTGIGGVSVPPGFIKTLKACLTWDQFQRPDIETLLSESSQLLYILVWKPREMSLLVKSTWGRFCKALLDNAENPVFQEIPTSFVGRRFSLTKSTWSAQGDGRTQSTAGLASEAEAPAPIYCFSGILHV